MTLEDIEAIPKEMLLATDIAPYLGADPHKLRMQAAIDPDKLGFATVRYGTTTVFPKQAFVYFMKYGRSVIP